MSRLNQAESRVAAMNALSVRERRILGWSDPRREAHRAQRRYGRELIRAEVDSVQCDIEADADDLAMYCQACGGPCTGDA